MDYMPVVVQATYLADYKIRIIFDNGEEKIADCEKWLKGLLKHLDTSKTAGIKKAPVNRSLWNSWCPGAESNRRHEDFQSSALPTELPGPFKVLRIFADGAQGRNRTVDTRIFSPLLYRLSYLGGSYKRAPLDSITRH